MKLFYSFITFCLSTVASVEENLIPSIVTYQKVKSESKLDVYVFDGFSPDPFRLFMNLEVVLNLSDSNNYEIYRNCNKSALLEEYNENNKFFGLFRKLAIWRSKHINPFERTYIGIETKEPYWIKLKVWHIDYIRFSVAIAGFILFLFAKNLARNVLFYYTSGCSIGLLASLLIIVWMLYRVLPKRSVGLSVLIGGWSFSGYILYSVWQNLYILVLEYQKWVAIYVVTVLVGSFAFCYYMGPPKHDRTKNLSQWALQLIGLVLIYCGCQIQEVSLATIFGLLAVYNIPEAFWEFIRRIWCRFFPPKPRLLTEEEYNRQGVEETKKALEQLKEYCRSPKCDSWKLMSHLDSPQRFANFVSGDSHLSDNEVLQYGQSPIDGDEDDESDNISNDSYDELEPYLPSTSLMQYPEVRSADRILTRRKPIRQQNQRRYKSFIAPPQSSTPKSRKSEGFHRVSTGKSTPNGVGWARSTRQSKDVSSDDD